MAKLTHDTARRAGREFFAAFTPAATFEIKQSETGISVLSVTVAADAETPNEDTIDRNRAAATVAAFFNDFDKFERLEKSPVFGVTSGPSGLSIGLISKPTAVADEPDPADEKAPVETDGDEAADADDDAEAGA